MIRVGHAVADDADIHMYALISAYADYAHDPHISEKKTIFFTIYADDAKVQAQLMLMSKRIKKTSTWPTLISIAHSKILGMGMKNSIPNLWEQEVTISQTSGS